jgi:3-oxoacyl-[acyl-carrier protein] reductase
MPELGLSGKNATITGASKGIGKIIALTLAREGTNVAAVARDERALKDLCQQLTQLNVKARYYTVDVTDYKQVETCVDKINTEFGSIDILVNNAGVTRDSLLMRLEDKDWDSVMQVNLKGYFNFIKAVSKYMIRQRAGKIINISSVIGLYGNIGQANYSASKAGVIALSKTAAKELGSRNITVNCVAPGFIKTEMTDRMQEERKQKVIDAIPLKRFGRPEDVANAVLFLASNLANYISGETIVVDGGMITILI